MLMLTRDPEKRIKQLIKKITHAGELDLDKNDLQELKYICKCKKEDSSFIVHVYNECIKNLKREHSQVRVAALKLIDYLFRKTHIFRKKLLDDFDLFLALTAAIGQGSNDKLKLPPPKKYSLLLSESVAKIIHEWHADFGPGYDKLRYAYRYLKEHKLIDFDQFRVRTREDQIKEKELLEKQERILTKNISKQLEIFDEIRDDIEQVIVQIESLITILVPDNETILNSVDECPSNSLSIPTTSDSQIHAIPTSLLSNKLDIEFDKKVEVKFTKDNQDVINALKEFCKQLTTSYIPKLATIVKTISKRSEEFMPFLRRALDLKNKAMNIVLKISDLNIMDDEKKSTDEATSSDSDSDSDFEEVQKKEDIESYIPKSMRAEYGLTSSAEIANDDKESVGISFDDSSFSKSETGPLTCRVKLDSGKLCPRMDKIKCPFHGKIIARDTDGLPIDKEARLKELQGPSKSDRPDWQDPVLLKEIEASIGIDLTLPQYTKKQTRSDSNKRKLENLRTCDKSPKKRLEKRIQLLSKYQHR